jgi:hypothetical protein
MYCVWLKRLLHITSAFLDDLHWSLYGVPLIAICSIFWCRNSVWSSIDCYLFYILVSEFCMEFHWMLFVLYFGVGILYGVPLNAICSIFWYRNSVWSSIECYLFYILVSEFCMEFPWMLFVLHFGIRIQHGGPLNVFVLHSGIWILYGVQLKAIFYKFWCLNSAWRSTKYYLLHILIFEFWVP